MNGPEHYQRAEALLDCCQLPSSPDIDDVGRNVELFEAVGPDIEGGVDSCRNALLAAQVHATLALAAAAIEPTVQALARGEGTDERIITEWAEAVSG